MILLFCEATEEGRLCLSPTKFCRNYDKIREEIVRGPSVTYCLTW